MQRAPANFERTNGGRWRCPGLGLGLRSGSFAQGACGGGRDTLKGGPHSGIGETSWRAKAASDSLDSGRLAAPGAPFLARLAMGWPISPLWTYALGIPPRNLPIAMRLSPNAALLSRFIATAEPIANLNCALSRGTLVHRQFIPYGFDSGTARETWTHGSRNTEAWKHWEQRNRRRTLPGLDPGQQIAAKSPKLSARMRGCRIDLRFAMSLRTPWPVGVVVERNLPRGHDVCTGFRGPSHVLAGSVVRSVVFPFPVPSSRLILSDLVRFSSSEIPRVSRCLCLLGADGRLFRAAGLRRCSSRRNALVLDVNEMPMRMSTRMPTGTCFGAYYRVFSLWLKGTKGRVLHN